MFLLILTIFYAGESANTTTASFGTQNLCEAAGRSHVAAVEQVQIKYGTYKKAVFSCSRISEQKKDGK